MRNKSQEYINTLTKKGWTISSIADHPFLQVSRQTIHAWKNGKTICNSGHEEILKFLLDQEIPERIKLGRPIEY